jgi:hypothetical protein
MLAIGPKVQGSNPTEDDSLLRAIKIRSTTSFVEKAELPALCRNILRHVKETYRYEKTYFVGKIHGHI